MQEIQCKFVSLKKSKYTDSVEEKSGRYSQCSYNIPGYGISAWVVMAYLEVDYKKYYDEGMSEGELIEHCASFLSKPPVRKKYQKKKPRSLYGNLEPVVARWRSKKDASLYAVKVLPGFTNRLAVEFIIDERRNKHFWSEGITSLDVSRKKKKGSDDSIL